MKFLKFLILIMLLSTRSMAQTTSWSSTPVVSWQTRLFNNNKQVRALWGTSLFSFSDSLNLYVKLNGGNSITGDQIFNGNITLPNTFQYRSIDVSGRLSYFSGADLSLTNGQLLLRGGNGGSSIYHQFDFTITDGNGHTFDFPGNGSSEKSIVRNDGLKAVFNTTGDLSGVPTQAKIDSAIAAHESFYKDTTVATGGVNNITIPALSGKILLSVTRSGLTYYPTTSTTPTGNRYYNNGAGNLKFQDNFVANEVISAVYKNRSNIVPTSYPTFASHAALMTAYTGYGNTLFYVTSDETNTDDYGNLNQPALYSYVGGVLSKISQRLDH